MGLEGQRADGRAIKLVNAPSFQLQDGRAKVPNLLRLTGNFGQSCAQTSGQIQIHTDVGIRFPGVAGSAAGDGYNRRLSACVAWWIYLG